MNLFWIMMLSFAVGVACCLDYVKSRDLFVFMIGSISLMVFVIDLCVVLFK